MLQEIPQSPSTVWMYRKPLETMVDQLPTSTGAGDLPYEWPKITWVSLLVTLQGTNITYPWKIWGKTST